MSRNNLHFLLGYTSVEIGMDVLVHQSLDPFLVLAQ